MKNKIYNTAIVQLNGIKRLPMRDDFVAGFIDAVFRQAQVPRGIGNEIPVEYFEAIDDAIHYVFYGGCEPEWDTDEEVKEYYEMMDFIYNGLEWGNIINCRGEIDTTVRIVYKQ
jgi:hypothetical protein